jgi:hypothetical protein
VDGPADLAVEHVVDEPVLLDPREAGEPAVDDLGAQVVPAARQIGDHRPRARQRPLDALLHFLGGGHA